MAEERFRGGDHLDRTDDHRRSVDGHRRSAAPVSRLSEDCRVRDALLARVPDQYPLFRRDSVSGNQPGLKLSTDFDQEDHMELWPRSVRLQVRIHAGKG
jgi:hypothetical protein